MFIDRFKRLDGRTRIAYYCDTGFYFEVEMYKWLKIKGRYFAGGSYESGYQVLFCINKTNEVVLIEDGFNFISEAQERVDELNGES